ncbi:MAG: DUF2892 domain-containing protein [Elusimicrobia bacterium]|nr:DUF2892 domain-containing protein [Elusimicrobiota bacterium]
MTMNDMLRLLAGAVTLAAVTLGWFVSPWFYLLAAAVALNLIQSAFSKWCPAMWVLAKLGFK